MTFEIKIPNDENEDVITLEPGESVIFVGANGSGKTRLAVKIEENFGEKARRISAHRALSIAEKVAKVAEKDAKANLEVGQIGYDPQHITIIRKNSKWQRKPEIQMQNDFHYLLQYLLAEQASIANSLLKKCQEGKNIDAIDLTTCLMRLKSIWDGVYDKIKINDTADSVEVVCSKTGLSYNASEMSDGERAVFYLIGQVLVADPNQLIIVDEPELHVHPSILSKLWDALEGARPDCAFFYITHDLHFASNRIAQKFVMRDLTMVNGPKWTIERVPTNAGFPEDVTTLILGSRRPILFVEGDGKSLDLSVYRACYPDWTVIPRGSCRDVIHSVTSFNNSQEIFHVKCAGIVDRDGLDERDIEKLQQARIDVLPVSEIENLFLLPEVCQVILKMEAHSDNEIREKLLKIREDVFEKFGEKDCIEDAVLRYCKRRLDRALEYEHTNNCKSIEELEGSWKSGLQKLVISDLADSRRRSLKSSIENEDMKNFLAYFDGKGLLELAAKHLRNNKVADFKSWIVRELSNTSDSKLRSSLQNILPTIELN